MKKKIYLSMLACMTIGTLSIVGAVYAAYDKPAVRQVFAQYETEAETPNATQTTAFGETNTEEKIICSLYLGAEDEKKLCRIAMAEAEGEDTEGKALVMLVVLNRVWSEGFPDSIEDVIMEKNQFTPVANGRYESCNPDDDCRKALSMIEHGWDESQGALYFESAHSEDSWHARNLQYLFRHGNHSFYKERSSYE